MLKQIDGSSSYLFKSPAIKGWENLVFSGSSREICGVQHMKFYVFDDNCLISGANLSDTYFTNRQDRYVLIKNSELADYLQKLIKSLGKFSYSYGKKSSDVLREPEKNGEIQFKEEMEQFVGNSSNLIHKRDPQKDVLVFPSFQLGPYYFNQDEILLKDILSNCHPSHYFRIASAYLNFPPYLARAVTQSENPSTLITANVDANGFFGAKGIKSVVPLLYENLAYKMHQDLNRANSSRNKELLLFSRSGWSFHQKGLWLSEDKVSAPYFMNIGSSNYGLRSFERDLECSFSIISTIPEFQKKIVDEQESIKSYLMDSGIMEVPRNNKIVRAFSKLVSNYL
jgi:CDP-diacylglycerol--glycerol-3-phosphate 3-phosphatidyltransferase